MNYYLGEWSQITFSQETRIDGGVTDVRCHTCRIRQQILTIFCPPGGATLLTDYWLQQENTRSLTLYLLKIIQYQLPLMEMLDHVRTHAYFAWGL